MNKIQQRVQLLALFSIFFIYKALTAATPEEMSFWIMFTIVYLVSIVIMLVIFRGWKEALEDNEELRHKFG